MVQLVARGGVPVTVQVLLGSSTAVTVYSVKGPPLAGASQETVACALPAVAAGFSGAEGTGGALGVTALETVEAAPVPLAVVARTVKV